MFGFFVRIVLDWLSAKCLNNVSSRYRYLFDTPSTTSYHDPLLQTAITFFCWLKYLQFWHYCINHNLYGFSLIVMRDCSSRSLMLVFQDANAYQSTYQQWNLKSFPTLFYLYFSEPIAVEHAEGKISWMTLNDCLIYTTKRNFSRRRP